jgi:hypothetical protein
VLPGERKLIQNLRHLVWKRMKDLLYLGSLHIGDIPEFYGFTGDHVGTDALGMHSFVPPPSASPAADEATPVNFINHQNPNHPSGSSATSPLSNITWPKYTLDSKKVLLFSDDAGEEYTTIPDTYRADGIAAINEVLTALRV